MQILKFLTIFCVAAFGLATLHAQRADTEEQAKARELLRQKMAELGPQQPAPAARPAPDAAFAPVVTPPPAVAAPPQPAPPARAANPALAGSTTRLTPEAEAQARAELRRKMAELDPSSPATPRAVPTPAPITQVGIPIPAAVTSSKNQKLAELLTRYRSNVITPEEYHKKRAEILAQP